MIDLHVHILPGLDDGPQDLEEALAMAEAYGEAGFLRLAATPHWVAGSVWAPEPEEVLKRLGAFKGALAARGVGLEVAPGMEIALTSEIPSLLREGRLLTLNSGPYVLIEPPFQRLPVGWDRILFELMSQGYRVLMGHPERCDHLAAEPELFEELVRMGVGIQVNWKSLLGRYGESVKETAWALLKGGLAHCLATDGHRQGDVTGQQLQRARRELKERLGDVRARLLVEENPARIWSGEAMEKVPPVKEAGTKGLRRRWLRWH